MTKQLAKLDENNRVIRIANDYIAEREGWIGPEIGPGCRLGAIYEGGVFSDPPTPPVTKKDVRAFAGHLLQSTDWMIVRAADPSSGEPVPQDVLDYRGAVRAASNKLEAMDPIPDPETWDGWP